MDHLEAIRKKAAERYVLKQLSPMEAEAFEEHFFSCPECAEEVRWVSMFEENARAVVRASEAQVVALVTPLAGEVTEIHAGQAKDVAISVPPGPLRLIAPGGAERLMRDVAGADRILILPARELEPGDYQLHAGSEVFRLRVVL